MFTGADELYGSLKQWLCGPQAGGLTHGELEERLAADGRELLRQLLQDSIDLRAVREQRVEQVLGADGVRRASAEPGHERTLQSVFGDVRVGRIAYRARGHSNLYPADDALNLPEEKQSHGLRRLAAIESTRGSFTGASDAILRSTGQCVASRQVQELARASAVDFEQFYGQRDCSAADQGHALVLSCDGKGVVMRADALRPATKKHAQATETKLKTRLLRARSEIASGSRRSPRSTRSHRRSGRRPTSCPSQTTSASTPTTGPRPRTSGFSATVSHDAATAIARMFEQAQRRDPAHERDWVALVDGNNHQIDRIIKEARNRKVNVTILVDCVHVLEYLWGAAWSFFNEGDPAAERWVRDKARAVLDGQAGTVAAAIRRKATTLGLDADKRAGADRCADYLLAKRPYLDYPTALTNGWPIATGVIEGTCRHLAPDGHHRGALGAWRRRSRTQATSPHQQWRLRRLLAIPSRTGTQTRPSISLRQHRRLTPSMKSLQKICTQVGWSRSTGEAGEQARGTGGGGSGGKATSQGERGQRNTSRTQCRTGRVK